MRKLKTGVALAGLVLPLFLLGSGPATAAGTCTPGSIRDFNGDSRDDIAIGDPNATVGGQVSAGYVVVQYGSLGIGPRVTLTQSSAGVGDTAQAGDQFGAVVTTGFIDADGCADLVVSAPGEDLAITSTAGAVSVIFGSPEGLGKGRPGFTLSQGTGIMPGNRGAGDRFGSALATPAGGLARLLAIGAPNDNVASIGDAGTVTVVRFNDAGDPSSARLFSQNTSGISDGAEPGDRFGAAVGMMGERGGSTADLVVGVPGEDVGSVTNAGTVQTIRRVHSAGPYPNDLLNQNSSGVSDSVEVGDEFGSSLYVHFQGGSLVYNMLVSAPKENLGSVADAGVVHYLLRNSLTGWGQFWMASQDSAGVTDSAESGDLFGTTVAIAGFVSTPGGLRDLILIGSPHEDVGSASNAGLVQVLDTLGRSEFTLSQSSSGVAGSPASGDHFGTAVDSIGYPASLLITAPDDTGFSRGVMHGIRWNRLFTGSGLTYTLTPGTNGSRFGASIDSA